MAKNTDMVSVETVAGMFGVNPKTVARWDKQGKFHPTLITPGGHRRYSRTAVQEYIDKQVRAGGSR